MKKTGFILIEVLVSLLIASLLSIGMLNSLSVVFKTNEILDSVMDLSASALRIQQQLERDLSGAMVPQSLLITTTSSNAKQPVTDGQETKESAAEKKQDKPFFLAKNKDANTEFLSFITTNPLASFWSDSAGQATSRSVRVVYRLEPDKENVSLFRLMRQEGMDLDIRSYDPGSKKVVRALEVARFIKKCTFSFLIEDEEAEQKTSVAEKSSSEGKNGAQQKGSNTQKKAVEEKKTITYKTLNEWQESKDDAARKKMPNIPRFVRLNITLFDTKKIKEETFESVFPIFSDGQQFSIKEVSPQAQQQAVPPQQGKKTGGIRSKLAKAGPPKTMPGGLLGQFTRGFGVRA